MGYGTSGVPDQQKVGDGGEPGVVRVPSLKHVSSDRDPFLNSQDQFTRNDLCFVGA